MFSLTALAAVAAMAFVGATSASAEDTTLCKENTETLTCPAGQQASHVHFVSAKADSFLLNSTLDVSCVSLFLGDTVGGTLGKPLLIEGNFTYSSCTTFCSAKEENGPAHLEVLKTAQGLADVTGEGLVTVNCFGFFKCSYIGTNLTGHGTGAGHVTFEEAAVKSESGGSCPATASLDALFVSLENLFVRS